MNPNSNPELGQPRNETIDQPVYVRNVYSLKFLCFPVFNKDFNF